MLLANKNFPLIGPSKTALIGTLAALVFAANCAGAPGTIAVTGITTSSAAPSGFIYDGARMWVTDATLGLCQINGGKLSSCVLPSTSAIGVKAVLGQPAYDSVGHFAYVPDMSAASKGIWRYSLVGTTFSTASAFNLASTAGLGAQRPGAVTLGDDGNLYASMTANNTFVRVNLPATAAQTVDIMGRTLSGSPARGLAFVGPQLWYADTDGEVIIPGASACATKCSGTLNTQVGVPNPLSIAFDSVNSFVYMGTSFGAFRYNLLTGQADLYSKHWVNGVVSGLFSNVNGVGVDTAGTLYILNDPTASQVVGGATAYSVPVNSIPDGLGNLGSPAATVPPFLSPAPGFANNALLYATGMTTPRGIAFIGTHVWVADATLGLCKADPTKTPNLTACATLPAGFVPGTPVYDNNPVTNPTHLVYVINTAAALPTDVAIAKLTFVPATETMATAGAPAVTTAVTVVLNSALTSKVVGSTAPTALAMGPDGQLYVAMAGTNEILRVTAPAAAQQNLHIVTFIGTIFDTDSVSIAFHNSDLWAAEKASASIIYGATTCLGNCTSLFFPQAMQLPPLAVTSDGTNVFIGDGQKVMMFDPIANVYATMADTGVIAGVPTVFNSISGLAADGQGHIFAADAGPLWQLGASTALPTITSMSPNQAPESSVKAVTITGTGFLPTSLVVSTCASGAVVPGNVTVVSLTQITATFSVNPVGPLGPCAITVNTTAGASAVSAGSSFTVLIGPPALTSVIPNSGFRGRTVPVVISGANMGSGAVDLMSGITITGGTGASINAAGTSTTASFAISPITTLGARNLTMTTPSGTSNILPFTVNAAPPVLTGISPVTGAANTTVTVTLTGTDLFEATVNPPANFTPNGLPVVNAAATSLTQSLNILSAATAGPKSITVTSPGGTSLGQTFTVLPALTSIATVPATTPASARAGASTTVVLTGTSLAGVTSVTAPNISVTNIVATATTVTATFTSLSTAPVGPVNVTVTDPTAVTPSNAVTFTLIGPIPVITSINPITGGTGATIPITVTGTGLTFGTLNLPVGVTVVGTPSSTFTTLTANIVIAGNAPLGLKTISVTTPGAGNTSNTANFTIFALAPLLNTIAPTSAVANGQTLTLTLTGQGFTGTTSVNHGAGITVGSFTVVSANSITASLTIGSTALTQSISVTNLNGTSNALTFGIVPTLSSITSSFVPAGGPANSSVAVTITGNSLTGATINTGSVDVTATAVTVNATATSITATFSIGATAVQGNRSITVTTLGGTSNGVTFNVMPRPPLTTAINSPFTRGSNSGVTLQGNFLDTAATIGAIKVFLNGVQVPLVATAASGSILVPAGTYKPPTAAKLEWNWTIPTSLPITGAGQVYTITVTTPSGTSAPLVFTVK